jgi:signal transduction histidine kinase
MKANIKLRDLILSKNIYLETWSQYKRSILTGLVIMLAASIGLYYSVLNVLTGINIYLLFYVSLFLISTLSFYLNRIGKQILASGLILTITYIIVFYFSSLESTKTGVYLYYLTSSIGAFALLGYEKRKLAILYCIANLIAFQLAYLDVFQLYDENILTDEFTRTFFTVNFISSMLASVLIVYFLMNINFHSEKSLKESENTLRDKNQMLRKANDELDRFVYSTSHDLKAPLSSILGLVNIAEKSTDREELAQYLDMMKDRIHTMDGFIRDITDYSRNNRVGISTEKILLKEFIDEIIQEHSFAEGITDIVAVVEIANDLKINTDKSRLKIIINNLINNSIKYRHPHRNLLISVSALPGIDAISIQISDNGQGIKSEHHTKIFDMFYRASENSKGSGLGLYIVKEAIVKLGGKIEVNSDYGIGTSFAIEIPNKPPLPVSLTK